MSKLLFQVINNLVNGWDRPGLVVTEEARQSCYRLNGQILRHVAEAIELFGPQEKDLRVGNMVAVMLDQVFEPVMTEEGCIVVVSDYRTSALRQLMAAAIVQRTVPVTWDGKQG